MVRLNAPSIEGAFRLQTEKNYLPDLNLGNVHVHVQAVLGNHLFFFI